MWTSQYNTRTYYGWRNCKILRIPLDGVIGLWSFFWWWNILYLWGITYQQVVCIDSRSLCSQSWEKSKVSMYVIVICCLCHSKPMHRFDSFQSVEFTNVSVINVLVPNRKLANCPYLHCFSETHHSKHFVLNKCAPSPLPKTEKIGCQRRPYFQLPTYKYI